MSGRPTGLVPRRGTCPCVRHASWIALGVWALIALGAPTSTLAAETPSSTIDLRTRRPLAVLVVLTREDAAFMNADAVASALRDGLEPASVFQVEPYPVTELVRICKGKLTCLARSVRPDYDRTRLTGAGGKAVPYRDYVERNAGRRYSKFLAIISYRPRRKGPHRVAVTLLNTDLAIGPWHDADRTAESWEEAAEDAVGQHAVLGRSRADGVESKEALQRYLRETLVADLQKMLPPGAWGPYGTIDLIGGAPDARVLLNGKEVGRATEGATRVTGLKSGPLSIRLEHDLHAPFETRVDVVANSTSQVRVDQRSDRSTVNDAVLYSGLVIASVGVAFTAAGVVQAANSTTEVCTLPTNECDVRDAFVRLGDGPLLTLPLGYSLVATGASFSLGALLSDSHDVPWLALGIGVAAGALSYGLSAALNGPELE